MISAHLISSTKGENKGIIQFGGSGSMEASIWKRISYKHLIPGTICGIAIIYLLFSLVETFPTIDTEFYVTSVQAYDIIASLTIEQIASYRLMLAIDFIFPILYSLFIILCMAYFLDRKLDRPDLAKKAAAFPLVTLCLDYCENITIIAILSRYPEKSPAAELVGYFTSAKWGSLIISLVVLLTSILFYASKKSGLFGD